MSEKYHNFSDENEGNLKFDEEISPKFHQLLSRISIKFNENRNYDRYLMPPNLTICENHLV